MVTVPEPRPEWVNAVRYCRWPDCDQPRNDDPEGPPLCMAHAIRVGKWVADLYGRSVLDPIREAHQVYADVLADVGSDQSVVYYLRHGDHVKIGTTTNLERRLTSLYATPDALLATEPGDRELEQARHAQFAAERVYRNRELFNPSRRLLAHIGRLAA